MTAKIRGDQRSINRQSAKEAAAFVFGLREASEGKDGIFDSAASQDFISSSLNQNAAPVPETLQALLDETPKDLQINISRAILDGVSEYEQMHGFTVPADLLEYAMHLAYATTHAAAKKYGIFDSASNAHADNLSLQPNRAVVAVLTALSEAIPFAHYLPTDIGSNEAKLAILSHQTGNQYGLYGANANLDGANAGDPYLTPSRVSKVTVAAGAIPTGQLTSVQATRDTCAAVAGNVVAVNLQRGRSQIYIGGKVVAREVTSNQSGSGNSTISGAVTIASTTYQIGGTINTDTGAHALTSTPMLPNGTDIIVEGFIDYERQPALTPTIVSNVDPFTLYAKAWRGRTSVTIDARTQISNELGLDPYSESIVAIQGQIAAERHYEVLAKAARLGANNTATFSMDWATGTNQGAQKTRAQILQDMQSAAGAVSQKMAIDTLGFGVSHWYVGTYMKAMIQSLPRELFEPSGLQDRAGIFRLGRLFGTIEVYYTPKILSDSNSSSQILAIGRAPDVSRNPFVLGDAVPPSVFPLAVGTDFAAGAGFYARNFTEVNPHSPSASACGLINVTNIGL